MTDELDICEDLAAENNSQDERIAFKDFCLSEIKDLNVDFVYDKNTDELIDENSIIPNMLLAKEEDLTELMGKYSVDDLVTNSKLEALVFVHNKKSFGNKLKFYSAQKELSRLNKSLGTDYDIENMVDNHCLNDFKNDEDKMSFRVLDRVYDMVGEENYLNL